VPIENLDKRPFSISKLYFCGANHISAFFSLFTAASFLIPTPMFPGNWFCTLISERIRNYVKILSAIFNGVVYGIILWLVFIGINRKLAE
jgi:hypothetical protein